MTMARPAILYRMEAVAMMKARKEKMHVVELKINK